jgi:hypothetical protein
LVFADESADEVAAAHALDCCRFLERDRAVRRLEFERAVGVGFANQVTRDLQGKSPGPRAGLSPEVWTVRRDVTTRLEPYDDLQRAAERRGPATRSCSDLVHTVAYADT